MVSAIGLRPPSPLRRPPSSPISSQRQVLSGISTEGGGGKSFQRSNSTPIIPTSDPASLPSTSYSAANAQDSVAAAAVSPHPSTSPSSPVVSPFFPRAAASPTGFASGATKVTSPTGTLFGGVDGCIPGGGSTSGGVRGPISTASVRRERWRAIASPNDAVGPGLPQRGAAEVPPSLYPGHQDSLGSSLGQHRALSAAGPNRKAISGSGGMAAGGPAAAFACGGGSSSLAWGMRKIASGRARAGGGTGAAASPAGLAHLRQLASAQQQRALGGVEIAAAAAAAATAGAPPLGSAGGGVDPTQQRYFSLVLQV